MRNPPTAAPERTSGGLRFANPPYALFSISLLMLLLVRKFPRRAILPREPRHKAQ
jgi:hypothetical protein